MKQMSKKTNRRIHLVVKHDRKDGLNLSKSAAKSPKTLKRAYKTWNGSRAAFERAAFCNGAAPAVIREALGVRSLSLWSGKAA